MKTRNKLIGLGIAAAVAAALGTYAVTASAQYGPGYGPGMMQGYGPGYGPMHGYGYGPGYGHHMGRSGGYGPGYGHMGRGGGYGPGLMGPGDDRQGALNLTTDDVKTRLERWLTWRGNARLKVGEVKEQDADTIIADIVTKDNSLVHRFIVNRRTGLFRPDQG